MDASGDHKLANVGRFQVRWSDVLRRVAGNKTNGVEGDA